MLEEATSGDEICPSFMSRPARRAVCSMQSPIMLMDACCTVSGIVFGNIWNNTGRGWTCESACNGSARGRYCPLALEKRAVRNKIYYNNDGFVFLLF